MKNFRSRGKFKKEVLKIIVNMMDEKEIKEMRQIFRKLDINNTNKISVQDLKDVIQKIGNHQTEKEIQDILSGFELDQD